MSKKKLGKVVCGINKIFDKNFMIFVNLNTWVIKYNNRSNWIIIELIERL